MESNVGGGFSSVSAGHSGLVCAIKDNNLYLRSAVTSKNPTGSHWENFHCDAVRVLVGTRYIVRQTSLGSWYFTKGFIVEGLFDWKAVGLETDETFGEKEDYYDEKPDLSHYVLDSRDKLYAFTEKTQVAFCDLSKANLQWTIVIDSFTSTLSKYSRIFKWVASLWNEECIISATADKGRSIWCHTTNTGNIYQLVTSQVGKSMKYNWESFPIPCKKTDELILVESCKVTLGNLYFVLTRGKKHTLVLFSLIDNDEDKFVDVVYPGIWPCLSLATSYLPYVEEERECCDDGSCSNCLSLKRPRVKDKGSSSTGNGEMSLELHVPEAKRRKVVSHNSLLDGVTVRSTLNNIGMEKVRIFGC